MAKKDKADPHQLPTDQGASGAIAFTSFDVKQLPGSVTELAVNPNIYHVQIGACFAVSRNYPGGTYWFGLVF